MRAVPFWSNSNDLSNESACSEIMLLELPTGHSDNPTHERCVKKTHREDGGMNGRRFVSLNNVSFNEQCLK
jgi:hypothetical protein